MERQKDLKESVAKRKTRMDLRRQLSRSMDNICIRRENEETTNHAVDARLYRSIDNLCSLIEESKTVTGISMPKEADRPPEMTDALYVGKKKNAVVPNMFSKATNRLSHAVDQLFHSNVEEKSKLRFLTKGIKTLDIKGFRKNRQKEDRQSRQKSGAYLGDDNHEADNELTDGSNQECLEFHADEREDNDFYKEYKGIDKGCYMSFRANGVRKAEMRLGRQMSRSMGDLSFGREDAKTVDSINISRLSKSTENLFWEGKEATVTQTNMVSRDIDQLSDSIDNVPDEFENVTTRVFPTMFSKVTNRLSKSVDNLFLSNHAENAKPHFLSKATRILEKKGFRKDKLKGVKRRHKSMTHLEYDCHEIDIDTDSHWSLCSGLDGTGDEEKLHGYRDIRTSHYLDVSTRETCTNQSCKAVFSFHVHPHHCRRCGGVFCSNCLRLRRNLNRLAQPDPNGLPCKVCETCFHENVEMDIITSRSLTEEFLNMRSRVKSERNDIYCEVAIERKMTRIVPVFWREQIKIDVQQECRRLLNGFSDVVNNADKYVQKTIHELRKHVDVPAWQKSVYWALEKAVSTCRLCHTRFRKFHRQQKLRNCRVCGLALCKSCANKELLVYFEDSEVNNNERCPKVSIIKYDGCPEVEPELSVLLYICSDCKSEILQRQLEDAVWFEDKPVQIADMMSQIADLHDEITSLQVIIKEKEDQIQRMTQEMEGNLQNEPQRSLQALAANLHLCGALFDSQTQQQKDGSLNDLEISLSKLPTYINELKEILNNHTGSTKETTLLKNIIKGKCDFYFQHKQILCELQRKTGTL